MLGFFLDIFMQKLVNIAGLNLLSLEGFACRVGLSLAVIWELDFGMFPVVLSNKVIWCTKGTEFHCANLPRLKKNVIYSEHSLPSGIFLKIASEYVGRQCLCDQSLQNLWSRSLKRFFQTDATHITAFLC